eukprot:RCo048960
MHWHQRLLESQALFLGRHVDGGLAALLHRFQGTVVFHLGDLVGVAGGLFHGVFQLAADIGRQAVPELLVDDDGVAQIAMLGQGQVLLHFVHLLGVQVGNRVLGTIDNAGLQRLIDFREGHHLRHGAEGAHLFLKHLGRLDAHLLALQVGRRLDRAVCREGLETVVPVGETADALGFQLGQQLLADGAVGHLAQVVVVAEDEGQVEDFEFLHAERAELGQRRGEHLHGAQLQGLHFFLVLVQGRVGIHLDLDLATGQFRRLLGEHFRCLALRRIGSHHVAELDHDRLLGIGTQRYDCGEQTDEQSGNFHVFSSGY